MLQPLNKTEHPIAGGSYITNIMKSQNLNRKTLYTKWVVFGSNEICGVKIFLSLFSLGRISKF